MPSIQLEPAVAPCRLHQSSRPFRSVAFLCPGHWPGASPPPRVDKEILAALQALGFRETIWQFVYKGQLAGLVLTREAGTVEIHVRFYEASIEAELEVGRHFIGHFLYPRYQAEAIVLAMILPRLSARGCKLAVQLFRPDASPAVFPKLKIRPGLSFVALAWVLAGFALPLAIAGFAPVSIAILALGLVPFLYGTLPRGVSPAPRASSSSGERSYQRASAQRRVRASWPTRDARRESAPRMYPAGELSSCRDPPSHDEPAMASPIFSRVSSASSSFRGRAWVHLDRALLITPFPWAAPSSR